MNTRLELLLLILNGVTGTDVLRLKPHAAGHPGWIFPIFVVAVGGGFSFLFIYNLLFIFFSFFPPTSLRNILKPKVMQGLPFVAPVDHRIHWTELLFFL